MERSELQQFNQQFQQFIAAYKVLEKTQHFNQFEFDLSLAEIHTIVAIGKNKKLNLITLANLQSISRSAVTQMINKLKRKDLVQKIQSTQKKNEYCLVLTSAGEAVFTEYERQQDYLMNELVAVLNQHCPEFLSETKQLMQEIEAVWKALPWI